MATRRAAAQTIIIVDSDLARARRLAALARQYKITCEILPDPDLLVSDDDAALVLLSVGNDLSSISWFKSRFPTLPLIVISSRDDRHHAVACFREGCDDFLSRSESDSELVARISHFLQCRCPKVTTAKSGAVEGVVGNSPEIKALRSFVGKLGPSKITTLITGPTGSGKEVAALALHRASRRVGGPLVALNCAAIPDALIEGELFGYEKGAFTGAAQAYPGKFALADKGTLFLDEIGELSASAQAKLLRAIDARQSYRLGGRVARSFDVRILAATNRDLQADMDAGRFRRDLYYRIAVAQIALPGLKERRLDIAPLAKHFVVELAGHNRRPPRICDDALGVLETHDWPGNARELKNIIELALLASEFGDVRACHLSDSIGSMRSKRPIAALPKTKPELLVRMLRECNGNKSEAAKRLNCSRMTLYRNIERYRLDGLIHQ